MLCISSIKIIPYSSNISPANRLCSIRICIIPAFWSKHPPCLHCSTSCKVEITSSYVSCTIICHQSRMLCISPIKIVPYSSDISPTNCTCSAVICIIPAFRSKHPACLHCSTTIKCIITITYFFHLITSHNSCIFPIKIIPF